jgi:deazaflavin-dependent oxidoreductase (nitroreductase family)
VTEDDAVVRALAIGPDSSTAERTIDITTLGRRSGIPRRIEVWFHRVDGRWYITGVPGPRSWYANVRAHPQFIVHLKHGVTADLPATAVPVDEPTRRRVITAVLDLQNRPEIAARVSRRQDPADWLAQPAGRDRVRRRAVADGIPGAVPVVRCRTGALLPARPVTG